MNEYCHCPLSLLLLGRHKISGTSKFWWQTEEVNGIITVSLNHQPLHLSLCIALDSSGAQWLHNKPSGNGLLKKRRFFWFFLFVFFFGYLQSADFQNIYHTISGKRSEPNLCVTFCL